MPGLGSGADARGGAWCEMTRDPSVGRFFREVVEAGGFVRCRPLEGGDLVLELRGADATPDGLLVIARDAGQELERRNTDDDCDDWNAEAGSDSSVGVAEEAIAVGVVDDG